MVLSFLGVKSGGQGSLPLKPAVEEYAVRPQGEFTKGSVWVLLSAWRVVSDPSLKQEVTRLIDKPDRFPVDQKNGGWLCTGRVCGYLYTCVSQSGIHVCGLATV